MNGRHCARQWSVFIVLLAMTTASAVLFGDKPKIFSHRKHIDETESACSACHDESADPPTVKAEGCKECHDTDPSRRLKSPASRPKIVFSHAIHNNVAECVGCHGRTVRDRQRRNTPLQAYEKCSDCHKENGIEINWFQCASCHPDINRTTKPTSHRKTWMTRHGKVASWVGFERHRNNCELCHAKSECKSCHMTMAPKNHTALWRVRTHGFAASMDRERCKNCHETGACINCHLHTAPQNHRGAWPRVHGIAAKVSPEKCRTCHSAAYGSSAVCVECHGGAR